MAGAVLAQEQPEASLIVNASDATFVGGEKAGGIVTAVKTIQPADTSTPIPLVANVTVQTAIEPCTSVDPEECNGAENFTVPDPEDPTIILTYGCSDMMDNDGDGVSDAEEPDCRGVQGFSFSVATDPCFGITRATTRGTIADLNTRPPGIRDPEGSFEKTEVVSPDNNAGQNGAVCAVVFSFTRPIILPQTGSEVVCILTGTPLNVSELGPGQSTEPCCVTILDPDAAGLVGSGEPVKTAVTVAGDTVNPEICNLCVQVAVEEGPPPPEPLAESGYRLDVTSPAATAGPKDPPGAASGVVPWAIEVGAPFPPPAPVPVTVGVTLIARVEPCHSEDPSQCNGAENFTVPDPEDPSVILSYGCSDMMDNDSDGKIDVDDEDCRSVQGWSISVASDACFNINRATTRGTIADLNVRPPGIRDPEGSFEKTEVVDPAMNNGQNGAVSAVVISFTRPIVLGQSSANVVCLLTGAIDASSLVNPGDMTAPCGIQVIPNSEEGLKGSGEPVKTAITVGGDTFVPNRCDASIKIVAASVVSPREFRRGNANDDNKIDVADPVFTLNALLRDGPEIACDDAADANDDGLVDVSDAVFSANYLFLNGPVPPAPGPSSCGADPTADSVSCAGSAVCP